MRKQYVAFEFFYGIRFVRCLAPHNAGRSIDSLHRRVHSSRTGREYSVSCSADFLCFAASGSLFWSQVRGSIRKCGLFSVALFVLPRYKRAANDDRIALPSLGNDCFILCAGCEGRRQANADARKRRSLGTRPEDHQESFPSFGSCARFQFTALQFPLTPWRFAPGKLTARRVGAPSHERGARAYTKPSAPGRFFAGLRGTFRGLRPCRCESGWAGRKTCRVPLRFRNRCAGESGNHRRSRFPVA